MPASAEVRLLSFLRTCRAVAVAVVLVFVARKVPVVVAGVVTRVPSLNLAWTERTHRSPLSVCLRLQRCLRTLWLHHQLRALRRSRPSLCGAVQARRRKCALAVAGGSERLRRPCLTVPRPLRTDRRRRLLLVRWCLEGLPPTALTAGGAAFAVAALVSRVGALLAWRPRPLISPLLLRPRRLR